mmetsp:Transcript_26434/g.76292  ORF Transcript_26434/g.76292 Transcript_26434/m.76292 type:complete len:329 (-) Transcript_26434:49-1035(-)
MSHDSDDEDRPQLPDCTLLTLPEPLLQSIIFYAAPRFERANLLCHRLGLTCRSFFSAVDEGLHNVWSAVHLEDYETDGANARTGGKSSPTRASKRLRRSPKDTVAASHLLLIERTSIAHFCVTEWAHSKQSPLSVGRLRWALREYGPNVRINQRVEIGGTILVECCRARYVKECVILGCVRELVERYDADPNLAATSEKKHRTRATNETAVVVGGGSGANRQAGSGGGLSPLIIASARGMPSVVRYLLLKEASPFVVGTGRFRLHVNSSKSVSGTYRSLEFARTMREGEILHGADAAMLRDIDKCIRLLEKAERQKAEVEEAGDRSTY